MLRMLNAVDSSYIKCACMCLSEISSHMTNFRVIIALSAKARHLSTTALYKGKIESKNRQRHWTIRYSYGATRDNPRYTPRQPSATTITEQSRRRKHYCGRSAHQGRGVGHPGVWKEEEACAG